MNALQRTVRRRFALARLLDVTGRSLVGVTLSSAVLLMVAQHAGNLAAAGDFALAMVGATVTLLLVEVFAHRLSRHG